MQVVQLLESMHITVASSVVEGIGGVVGIVTTGWSLTRAFNKTITQQHIAMEQLKEQMEGLDSRMGGLESKLDDIFKEVILKGVFDRLDAMNAVESERSKRVDGIEQDVKGVVLRRGLFGRR